MIRYLVSYLKLINNFLRRQPTFGAFLFIFTSWLLSSFLVFLVERKDIGANIITLADSLWWGVVTLLTVGYGDRYPVTETGRFIATFLMASGVGAIAIITAKISSFFIEQAIRERRGIVEAEFLKDHFVICGWKEEMSEFLIHILNTNQDFDASHVVLLNNVSDSEIEKMHSFGELKKVKVVKGEHYLEANLRRVAPEKAQKILILADQTPLANGHLPTLTEGDARTIMTAMTLKSIAKGVPVAAEILDPSMDQYLRIANVEEIIYSRSYSRMILAMASLGTGVTNIYHTLLDSHSPYFIETREIQDEFIKQPYGKLEAYYEANYPHGTLIGLLENSGNSHVAKEKALKRAQQTPNVAELVKNLHDVKELKFNNPRLVVPNEYIIPDGAMAIVLENREGSSHWIR